GVVAPALDRLEALPIGGRDRGAVLEKGFEAEKAADLAGAAIEFGRQLEIGGFVEAGAEFGGGRDGVVRRLGGARDAGDTGRSGHWKTLSVDGRFSARACAKSALRSACGI